MSAQQNEIQHYPAGAMPMAETSNPFRHLAAANTGANVGAIAIEQERAIAEAQGKMILAKRFPRSMAAVTQDFMDACKSPAFAAKAFYSVPNRGTGPSIRFAEELARCYGNFDYGHRELSRSEGKSEVEVYAWDMEKNNYARRQVTIMHVRDKRDGGAVKLTDQGDIDGRIANVASKQVRSRILALMPKHVVEQGILECRKTLAGDNDKPISQRVIDMAGAFAKYGVTVAPPGGQSRPQDRHHDQRRARGPDRHLQRAEGRRQAERILLGEGSGRHRIDRRSDRQPGESARRDAGGDPSSCTGRTGPAGRRHRGEGRPFPEARRDACQGRDEASRGRQGPGRGGRTCSCARRRAGQGRAAGAGTRWPFRRQRPDRRRRVLTMQWSPQQSAALLAVAAWLKDKRGPQVFRLFGFAGTGKTTLAKEIAKWVDGAALFGCFTGKAALVLRSKGCTGATTLHSLVYKPQEDELTGEVTFILNPDSPVIAAPVLIVDEVSMVGPELGGDVLSFGTKVLVLGDPFQLPPVSGEGFFTEQEPDVLLTEIHRQAAENPIIRMSMDLREGRGLALGEFGETYVRRRVDMDRDELAAQVMKADQVVVGMNKTRNVYNKRIRQLKGFTSALPMPGERLMCLKNNKTKGLLNGSQWTATKVGAKVNKIEIEVDSLDGLGDGIQVQTHMEFFGGNPKDNLDWRERKKFDEFDWAWAATCHKVQGSQYPEVLVFDEGGVFREHSERWRYTAITRAADHVKVLV